MGNATSLKIGQGHLRAMPTFQTYGMGISRAGIGHLWAIYYYEIWAFTGSWREKKMIHALHKFFNVPKCTLKFN